MSLMTASVSWACTFAKCLCPLAKSNSSNDKRGATLYFDVNSECTDVDSEVHASHRALCNQVQHRLQARELCRLHQTNKLP